jgi:hypothetical protein
VEISLRYTAAVRAAVEAARAPVRLEDLAAKIQAGFPAATPAKVTAMLTELVARRALITSLHAPGTEPDGLGHLVEQLEEAGAPGMAPVAGLAVALKEIHALLEQHNRAPADQGRAARTEAAARMRRLARTRRHPLAVDLRLDAEVALPGEVARDAERAALALTRLSAYPADTPAWRAYHRRLYERFGLGSLVPLLDVVSDSDSGIGWPDGYPGTVVPARGWRKIPGAGSGSLLRARKLIARQNRPGAVCRRAGAAGRTPGPGRAPARGPAVRSRARGVHRGRRPAGGPRLAGERLRPFTGDGRLRPSLRALRRCQLQPGFVLPRRVPPG